VYKTDKKYTDKMGIANKRGQFFSFIHPELSKTLKRANKQNPPAKQVDETRKSLLHTFPFMSLFIMKIQRQGEPERAEREIGSTFWLD
jgi:hypothetical protein